MTEAIEVEGLTKVYGDLLAVDHIDFSVRQGCESSAQKER